MPSDLNSFVAPQSTETNDESLIREALTCLDRFTDAFNECDTKRMDQELHFPHCMYSGSEMVIWNEAGHHPSDFFVKLKASGWSKTRYKSRESVLVSKEKVHFVVDYVRCDMQNQTISRHINLWVVTRINDKWGIALRSY